MTAAMPSGTGLDLFVKRFPERTFDVGIAEQHAVTFAAGMAAEGMNPCAYDQVVHDVALQNLPVRVAPDRLIKTDSQPRKLEAAELNAPPIVAAVLGALDRSETLRKPTLARTR